MWSTPLTVIVILELFRPDERNDQVQHHERCNDSKNHVLHAAHTRSEANMV